MTWQPSAADATSQLPTHLLLRHPCHNTISLTEFWKSYSIRHSIENIPHALKQITANSMRGVWRRLLPQCANSSDFEEETLIEEITNIGRELEYNGPTNHARKN
jgi:hypothetical protein